ncbi:MAG: response regulator [Candidatus Nanoarchaeia archaeon]|jgi:CheY-like chemotaxis protein|nr:response regulator [Candidatus Nanoarchaeia archaeon]
MTKILLVEDNEMNKDMLSRRLTKKGYEVIFAMDGQEAIDMAQSETPDVVLMDMGLPVKDGLQATKEIKENSDTSNIPIIALTANAMAEHRQEALDGGCDEYETKPIRLPSLLEKIEQFT